MYIDIFIEIETLQILIKTKAHFLNLVFTLRYRNLSVLALKICTTMHLIKLIKINFQDVNYIKVCTLQV